MPGIVDGKVAIVTGAGRGIGRSIALLMAQEGARVVVCDIGASLEGDGADGAPAHAVVDEIEKAGCEAIASTLSIGEPANADKIVQAALDVFGRVDILVNNAGILRDSIFHRMSWSDWADVINVHLHGSFIMSRACAARFREQNSGSYVHMTSIYLFNQNRPIRTLHRSEGWTPQKLAEQLQPAFGASFTPLERSGDVFCWDPV